MSENPFLQRMKINALDIGGEVEAPKQEEKQDEKKFEIPQEVVTAGIPLLIGALMGKPSIGAKVGAKTIADGLNRQYEIEKEQRKKLSSGDEKLYSYIDPLTGKKTYGFTKDAYGNEPVAASYIGLPETQTRLNMRSQMQVGTHAKKKEIDEQEEIQKGLREGKYGDTFNSIDVTPDMKKQADTLENNFLKVNKDTIMALREVDKARELLSKGTVQANDAAATLALRIIAIMNNKGALSERDANVAREQLSLINSAKERAYMERHGRLSPRVAQNIDSALETITNSGSLSLSSAIDKMSYARSLGDKSKKKYYEQRLSGYVPSIRSKPMDSVSEYAIVEGINPETGKKERVRIPRSAIKEAALDGYKEVQ